MTAIFNRELKAYFTSPFGYVFLAAYYLFSGFFFFQYNLYGNSTDMRNLFSILFTVTLFLVPILTMRLMSEDRRQKTDQLYYGAPIGSWAVIMGKFWAAAVVYGIGIGATLLAALAVAFLSTPEWPVIMGHFVGLLLLGLTLVAIGLFLSAITESQVIAAIGGFCVGFFLMLVETLAGLVENPALRKLVTSLSFQNRYYAFTLGMLELPDVVFFLSMTFMFVFFAICAFEKRRWV